MFLSVSFALSLEYNIKEINHMQNLKQKSINAAYWTFGSYAVSQAIRFGSNLVLTHILAPEYFGLMAIVTVFMIGLGMFSDIGLSQNIIQSDRSNDQTFLDTAWTLQIARGFILWLACIIGAYPMSLFYHNEMLLWVIPVAGFASVISSFNSTALDVASKNLSLKTLTFIELGTQLLNVVIMLLWALVYPSVWALVAGSLSGALVKVILSHTLFAGARNKLHWDTSQVKYMVNFGSWIFISTIFGFFVNSGSGLILGKFVSMAELGVFSLAFTLANMVVQVYQQVDNRVIFPLLVKIRDLENAEMRKRIAKIKLAVIGLFLPPLWILIIFGQQVVDLIFDHRYHGGGWILRLIALGSVPYIISGIGQFYIANGNSKVLMQLTIVKSIFYFIAIFVGYQIAGSNGIIIAIALYPILNYLIEVYVQHQYRVWLASIDISFIILTMVVVYIGFQAFPLVLP